MGKASGGPKSDLGNLTPRAFVIVYFGLIGMTITFWTTSHHVKLDLNTKFGEMKMTCPKSLNHQKLLY